MLDEKVAAQLKYSINPLDCKHEHCVRLDAIGIERFKCEDCGAVLYDAGDGLGPRFYRCSYTAWGYCSRYLKRRRKRCCDQIPTEWYQEAAYCREHRPVSRHTEEEKQWRASVRRHDERGEDHLAKYDAESRRLREELRGVRPLQPTAAPSPGEAASIDHRTIKW